MVFIKLDIVSLAVLYVMHLYYIFYYLLVMMDGIYDTYQTRKLYLESHCNCIFLLINDSGVSPIRKYLYSSGVL